MSPLHATLAHVRRRIALIQWISFQINGLYYAAIAACVALVIVRAFPVLGDPVLYAAAIFGASLVCAAVLAIVRRPDTLTAALAADERLGLDERLTSSLQLEGIDGPMVSAVHEDAQSYLKHIHVRRDFPIVSPPSLRWLALPVFLFGLGYVLMPELDLFNFKERQAMAMAQEKDRLEKAELIKEAFEPLERLENAQALDGLTMDIMGEMDELAEALAKGELSERQAMARILSKSEEIAEAQQKLANAGAMPKLTDDPSKYGDASEMAEAISQGSLEEAAKKAEELLEKLKKGDMSKEEKEKLSEDLNKLASSMSGGNPALSEAMSNLAALAQGGMSQEEMEGALKNAELSTADLKSISEQMKQMKMAGECMGGACKGMGLKPGLGKGNGSGSGSGNGMGLKASQGKWKGGDSSQKGSGMGGPGQGRGSQIGETPDVNAGFNPSMLPGELQNGSVLATVTELAPPDQDAESTVTFLEGSIVQVQAEAERALSQEEIPAGAKEFVRQYFGTMEQEQPESPETIQ